MKRFALLLATALLLTLTQIACFRDDSIGNGSSENVPLSNVPASATSMIQVTFPTLTIVKVEKKLNADGSFRVYEVYLSNGAELYFDANWTQVFDDNPSSGTDDSVDIAFSALPQIAQDYVNTNYAGIAIKKSKMKLDDSGAIYLYEVRLTNDTRIYFNAAGQFTGVRNN